MNTLTERYGVPACLAAAFHAALFLLVGPAPEQSRFTPPGELPQPRPFPDGLIEMLRPLPEEVVRADDVKPLHGGTAAPMLPELFTERRGAVVELPTEAVKPGKRFNDLRELPRGPGRGEGDELNFWGSPSVSPMLNALNLDRVPRALAQSAPEYPYARRQSGAMSEVFVEFDVDTTGRVAAARVVRGGDREFEEAAVRAVLKWRFEPGRKNGRVVPFRMAVPIAFSLEAE